MGSNLPGWVQELLQALTQIKDHFFGLRWPGDSAELVALGFGAILSLLLFLIVLWFWLRLRRLENVAEVDEAVIELIAALGESDNLVEDDSAAEVLHERMLTVLRAVLKNPSTALRRKMRDVAEDLVSQRIGKLPPDILTLVVAAIDDAFVKRVGAVVETPHAKVAGAMTEVIMALALIRVAATREGKPEVADLIARLIAATDEGLVTAIRKLGSGIIADEAEFRRVVSGLVLSALRQVTVPAGASNANSAAS